ncbi:hypothetical protein VNO77_19100 [Canavalia gladiata]|uniref:Uncharacterized protein n=1 Tax=Canavalia gladiata TaxID=3824 RepID=A0AAN9LM40_CANGL
MAVGIGTNLPPLLPWSFLDPLETYNGSMISGSTGFPCFTSGLSSLRIEDCLIFAYIILALLMYVPNELRGGMMGFSLAPANTAILLSMVQVSLMAFVVLGVLLACLEAIGEATV